MGFFDNPLNSIFPGSGELLNKAGDMWDSFTGKDQQQSANEANISSVREQMAFQERMSNTAHQRQVADLKAAGINPMLSAQLGGASSPSGASTTVSPIPSATNKFLSTAMDVANFAKDQRTARQNVIESQSRADLNTANAIKTAIDADVKSPFAYMHRKGTEFLKSLGSVGAKNRRFLKKLLERGINSGKEFGKDVYDIGKKADDYVDQKIGDMRKRGAEWFINGKRQ